jgi:hypothetical protein
MLACLPLVRRSSAPSRAEGIDDVLRDEAGVVDVSGDGY